MSIKSAFALALLIIINNSIMAMDWRQYSYTCEEGLFLLGIMKDYSMPTLLVGGVTVILTDGKLGLKNLFIGSGLLLTSTIILAVLNKKPHHGFTTEDSYEMGKVIGLYGGGVCACKSMLEYCDFRFARAFFD